MECLKNFGKGIISIIAIIGFVFYSLTVFAGIKIPEFEGVYLVANDGKQIELPEISPYYCNTKMSMETHKLLSGAGRCEFRYYNIDELAKRIPVLSDKQVPIDGFYLNAKDKEFYGLVPVSLAVDSLSSSMGIVKGVANNDCKEIDEKSINHGVFFLLTA